MRRAELDHLLSEVTDAQGLSALYGAVIGPPVTGQQLQQRCLAGTIRADQSDPIAGTDGPTQILQQRSAPVTVTNAEIDVAQIEHILAESCGGETPQADRVPGRGLVGDECVGRVDAEPGLRGAGGPRRSQASSLRSRFLRRAARPAACRARSARAST